MHLYFILPYVFSLFCLSWILVLLLDVVERQAHDLVGGAGRHLGGHAGVVIVRGELTHLEIVRQ